jgi:hypothetical protein
MIGAEHSMETAHAVRAVHGASVSSVVLLKERERPAEDWTIIP